jgi:hypothetical protein
MSDRTIRLIQTLEELGEAAGQKQARLLSQLESAERQAADARRRVDELEASTRESARGEAMEARREFQQELERALDCGAIDAEGAAAHSRAYEQEPELIAERVHVQIRHHEQHERSARASIAQMLGVAPEDVI